MKIAPTLFFLWLVFAAAIASTAEEGPNRPEPKPVMLDSKSTAVLVLDLNARCDDPKQVCSKITAPLGDFLDKARAASVPIIYTVSTAAKGKPIGELSAPLRRKENEVIIYRSEEHTSELQSHVNLVCRLLLEKKKKKEYQRNNNSTI